MRLRLQVARAARSAAHRFQPGRAARLFIGSEFHDELRVFREDRLDEGDT
jgi:hypothetical protein